MTKHAIRIGLAVLLAALPTAAQTVHGPVPIIYESGRGFAEIPFRLIRGHIHITADLGDHAGLDVILDSGLPADGVRLFADSRTAVLFPDEGRAERVPMRLPGVVLPETRLRRTSVDLGLDAVGMIGPDLLGTCVVVVDYAASVVRLHDPDLWTPPESAAELPLRFHDRSPFVAATVDLDADRSLDVICCVDLGSALGLFINDHPLRPVVLTGPVTDVRIGVGVEGPIHGRRGRVAALRLGPYALRDEPAAVSTDHSRSYSPDETYGNIGVGVLSRFTVTFDYRGRRLFLEPNGTGPRTPVRAKDRDR